jgi:hypothetical protein
VFENVALGTIFGPKGEQTDKKYTVRSFVICSFASNTIRVVKSKRLIWVGYVARMKEMRNAYKSLVENLKGKRISETCAQSKGYK